MQDGKLKLFIKKVKLVLNYGNELESVLNQIRNDEADRAFKQKQSHLKLCFKHQQEANHSHFSEFNCDHCKLLRRYSDKSKQTSHEIARLKAVIDMPPREAQLEALVREIYDWTEYKTTEWAITARQLLGEPNEQKTTDK